MRLYLIGNQKISKGSSDFQRALENARDGNLKVYCLCCERQPDVTSVRVDGKFHVRRREKNSHLHSESCFHYCLPSTVSGHHTIMESVTDQKDGNTALKVDFRLSRRPPKFSSTPSDRCKGSVTRIPPKPLALKSFFQYAYEKSGLTEWMPGFSDKRFYGLFRKRVFDVSGNIIVSGGALSSRLFIPETYDRDRKDEQHRQAKNWFENLGGDRKYKNFAIVMGEVNDIRETQYGGAVTLKHLYNLKFFVGAPEYIKISQKYNHAQSLIASCGGGHLLTIATCEWNGRYPIIDEIDFICVNRNWLPFERVCEVQCFEHFKNRSFSTTLRFNGSQKDLIASIVIKDTDPHTAVFVVEAGTDPDQVHEIEDWSKKCDMKSFIWNAI